MNSEKQRSRMYALGRAAGKQFRKGGPGRQVAKRAATSIARRGLIRLLRRF